VLALHFGIAASSAWGQQEPANTAVRPIAIELKTIQKGYDRKTCWVHARPGMIPGEPPVFLITMQKLRISGSDIFYNLFDVRSDDGGNTWSQPTEHAASLGRRDIGGGVEEGVCDFWPAWHARTGRLLGTGHTVRYVDDNLPPPPVPCSTAYSVYDPESRTWSPFRKLAMPDPEKFQTAGAGCVQRVDLENGEILLPIYYSLHAGKKGPLPARDACTVLRCSFDGTMLRVIEQGTELTVPEGRGFSEPSLAMFGGKYLLALRNDKHNYVAASSDGLHFGDPVKWTFDDKTDLGSYNTQQHWVTMPDALYLVYTRRGANNDHVFRHRAPLFIARVDVDNLHVLRSTEQVLVPERGARLGNFGVVRVSDNESWVTVSEWMQSAAPHEYDPTRCEKYGSDNSVFIAKVKRR
jgi:hypothetical protein